jgi:hypothetical protein
MIDEREIAADARAGQEIEARDRDGEQRRRHRRTDRAEQQAPR